MATTKKTNPQDSPDRFKLGEGGYLGLSIFNGVSQDEFKRELNFPNSITTYKQMSYHSAINSALTLFEDTISKATWNFLPPENPTEQELEQCQIVRTMLDDMEGSWVEFIKDTLSANIFGFSVHEKVYRKRYKQNGSMYDDGIIAWKKLPIRAQETIEKFIFSDDGNEILGVKQNLSRVQDYYARFSNRSTMEVILPRSKFMLFRTGKHRGDPFGKSPLRDAYLAWRFLTSLEELEATGVSKDLVGLPVLYLPPQYLSADASPDQKVVRNYYESAMRNLQMNSQSAMILPNAYDPETKQPLFKLDLLSVNSKKSYNISEIKEYYKNLIFTSLSSDILIMGQSSTGSFALGAIKNSLAASHAQNLLSVITEVLNYDLIRQTYELNGWETSRAGKLDFDNLQEVDLETISKGFQRLGSVNLLEVDRDVLNQVRTALNIDPLPEDAPVRYELMQGYTSRAGDGMAKGSGNGTSDSVASTDNSSINLDNAA